VNGHSLSHERSTRTNKVLSWEQLTPWVRNLCDALTYAHGQGIIHRDIKPANLLIDHQGQLKLADFGVARAMSDSASRGTGQSGAGTTCYMSPQQLDGKGPAPSDDVYSVGATLYELLSGKPPFHSGDIEYQIRYHSPTPLKKRLREFGVENPLPTHVEQTIMDCLSSDRRPKSAMELAERLRLHNKSQRRASAPSAPAATGDYSGPRPPAEPTIESDKSPPHPGTGKGLPRSSKRKVATAAKAGGQPGDSAAPQVPHDPPARRRARFWTVVTVCCLIALSGALVGERLYLGNLRLNQAKADAERIAKLEAEAKAKGETQRIAKLEADAKAKADAERIAKLEADANAKAEVERIAKLEADANAKAEVERIAKLESAAKTQAAPISPFPVEGRPWTNSLGMVFVPVVVLVPVGNEFPLFSIWETRIKDYQAFVDSVDSTNRTKGASMWKRQPFQTTNTHPAVAVKWRDATNFCSWLTTEERKAGKLGSNQCYRLPTAKEWDTAAGLHVGHSNSSAFLWGTNWPPPTNAGNFFGSENSGLGGIKKFNDGFPETSPVGSFPPRSNLYDLFGNVWEWCEDEVKNGKQRIAKGGSWLEGQLEIERLKVRPEMSFGTNDTQPHVGFRCVLDLEVRRSR
jgi:hypothetical protein